jgi:hypothetical protein
VAVRQAELVVELFLAEPLAAALLGEHRHQGGIGAAE